jgi:hypothetical protein
MSMSDEHRDFGRQVARISVGSRSAVSELTDLLESDHLRQLGTRPDATGHRAILEMKIGVALALQASYSEALYRLQAAEEAARGGRFGLSDTRESILARTAIAQAVIQYCGMGRFLGVVPPLLYGVRGREWWALANALLGRMNVELGNFYEGATHLANALGGQLSTEDERVVRRVYECADERLKPPGDLRLKIRILTKYF